MAAKVEIRHLEDLDRIAEDVGLPVGRRSGRSKEKKEWYVLLRCLKAMIASGTVELPIMVRNGIPPDEPDFVAARAGSLVALFEITEATVEADQKEMTSFERSKNDLMMLGDFGGRFQNGAGRPGLAWALDVIDAIKRKSDKAIFQDSSATRHLIIYPNSNASILLFDEEDEREAINDLRAELAKELPALSRAANACLIHVLGKHVLCFDALGEIKVLRLGSTA